MGVTVVYLVAPQAWAWRQGRLPRMRRAIDHLLCLFPFEEEFFRRHGIAATYIGHPLTRLARPSRSKEEFQARHNFRPDLPLIALLPGSRAGEAARHMPALLDAAARILLERPVQFALGAPAAGFWASGHGLPDFRERIAAASIQIVEGETWDVLAHADLALAASGTVATEAALLGTPMVTFYKVAGLSWFLGRFLVRTPFYTMVNLVAGRAVVPELMQNEVSGERLAAEALKLLDDPAARARMQSGLAEVAAALSGSGDPMERAAAIVESCIESH